MADVQEATAIRYLEELATKNVPGTEIANTPTMRANRLDGLTLEGQQFFEVPVQNSPVPQSVLDYAEDLRIIIRDNEGTIYE